MNIGEPGGAEQGVDEGRPTLATFGEARAEEERVRAAADVGRQVLDAVKAEVADEAEPAVDIAGNVGVNSVPVECFFCPESVGAEADKRITNEQVRDRSYLLAAGR